MAKIKITVEEYNKIAKDHYDLAKKLRHEAIVLICSECNGELQEQQHVDDTQHPFKRQMICSNVECGKTFYRIE